MENTMKTLTHLMLVAGLLGTPLMAVAEDSPHSISGNLSLVSDYAFRGVSQTNEDPAIQGGFDYAHSSGFYLGTWASNVDGGLYPGASLEWDLYGGYGGKITEDVSYNIGMLKYYYPGNNIDANTLEAYGGVTWKWLNVKLSYALSDSLFGVQDADGSTYLEANANFELPAGFTLGLHYGDTNVKGSNSAGLDYNDWKVGVSKELGGFNVGLAYTDTDIKSCTICDGRFILSVGKTF
jgi:uncharacterized protein (TIGR02001 family)